MRKRISVITLLIVLLNIFGQCLVSSAESGNEITLQEDFCLKNGFYDQNDYKGNKIVSRGEFTEILSKICNLEVVAVEPDKWSGYVYDGTVQEGDGTIFRDVDVSHPYYSTIKAVVDAGYMRGISENLFGPELNLTAKQAYIVFLGMINYAKIAEMEGGYSKLARELNVTKGLTVSEDEYLSYKNLAKVIYNMLDVTSYDFLGTGTGTFMNDVMKIKKVRGFLTDNGYTAIDGASTLKENCISVGGVVAEITPSDEYARNYIGRTVTMYYHYDEKDSDKNTVKYLLPDSSTDVYTFEAEDFVDYTGSAVKYRQGSSSKTISLSTVQYMIYNNKSKSIFNKATFGIDAGEITVIPKSVGDKTVIIINSVEYAYVTSVDTDKKRIQNKIKNFDAVLDLNSYGRVHIASDTGEEKGLSDIAAGNVLEVVRNSEQINITIISLSEKNFYINSIDESDKGTQTLLGDKKNFVLSLQYYKAPNKINLELGRPYDLYLNSKNEVVWIETRAGDFQVGFLIKTFVKDKGDIETRLDICDMGGVVTRYYCDQKLVISDRNDVRHSKLSALDIQGLLVGVSDLIRFKVNNDGLVKYIELPTDNLPANDDRLFKIADADDTTKWGGTAYPYQRGAIGFGGRIGVVSNVKVLKIPNATDASDYTKYKKTTLAEAFVGTDNTRRFIAYTTKRNDFAAEYIIAKSYANEVPQLKDSRSFFVVDKIVTMLLDEEDNVVGKKITGYLVYGTKSDVAKKEFTLYCDEDNYSVINSMKDLYQSEVSPGVPKTYSLQEGDIVRLAYNEDNYLQVAELVFRPTLVNPAYPTGSKGALAGSIGYYDSTNQYSNPVVIDENGNRKKGTESYGNARRVVGVDFRLALSWVNDKEENVYQVTTQDLSAETFSANGKGGLYMVDIMSVSPTSLVLVEYEDGKVVQIRPATAEDIKTREEVGINCSRILHNWYWGTGLHGFVINGQ